MVLGVGTDLAEIARIARSIQRFSDRFLHRVYTPAEIAYCMRKKSSAESFAARFAAKEAAAKALGTGISRGVSWQDGQRPPLALQGRAAQLAAALGVDRISLSLSHSSDMAIAVVIMEGTSR